MAKVKVEVTGAVVDGKGSGSVIEVSEKDADRLLKIGYVKEVKEKKVESKPKPKKQPKKKTDKTEE